MASLRDDERKLLRSLLEQRLCPKSDLEKILGRLKTKRRAGDPVTLQDMLVDKGLFTTVEVNTLMRRSSKRRRSNSARHSARQSKREASSERSWKSYDPGDSKSFVESLGRGKSTRQRSVETGLPLPKRSQRRPVVGGFQLEESLPPKPAKERFTSARRSAQSKRARKQSARHRSLERASRRMPPANQGSVELDHDADTMSLDADQAALAAKKIVAQREAEASRQDEERQRQKNTAFVYGIVTIVVLALIGLTVFVVASQPRNKQIDRPIDPTPIETPTVDITDALARLQDKLSKLEENLAFADMELLTEKFIERNEDHLSEPEINRLKAEIKSYKRQNKFQLELSQTFVTLRVLRGSNQFREAHGRLEELAERFQDLKFSRVMKRVQTMMKEIETEGKSKNLWKEKTKATIKKPDERPEKVVAEPYKLGPEPESRKARFARLQSDGKAQVDFIRSKIEALKKSRAALIEAEAKRVREATKERPLTVQLTDTVALKGAFVSRYDENGFTLKSGSSEITMLWDTADPLLSASIKRVAARGHAVSEMGLGRFCIEHGLFNQARRAYQRAMRLDGSLRSRMPDVDELERDATIFHGRVQRLGGGLIEVDYDFKSADQLQDFTRESSAKIARSTLEIRGRNVGALVLRNLLFEDQAEISIEPKFATGQGLLAIGFAEAQRKSDRAGLLLAFQPSSLRLVMLRWTRNGTSTAEKPVRLSRQPKNLEMSLNGDRIQVVADGRRVMSSKFSSRSGRVTAVLGVIGKNVETASFESASVKGNVGSTWLRKTFGAADARLRAAMARISDSDFFALKNVNRSRASRVSAEDDFGLSGLSAKDRAIYNAMLDKMKTDRVKGVIEAKKVIVKLLERRPGFAAGHYRLGLMHKRFGKSTEAFEQFYKAYKSCPHFIEAATQLATLLVQDGKSEEAIKVASRALEWQPDNASARFSRGKAYFLNGELKAALKDLELAVALNRFNDEAVQLRRNIEHVLRGPPWERKYVYESKHYRVETDISSKKAKFYAQHLEAILSYYCEQFGISPNKVARGKRAKVLIFDTREGFHSYAKLTTDDRVESFLGYYHPRFKQLLFYEDRRDRTGLETLRVLYHEGFHQFTHSIVSELPFWFSEGMAEYYAGSRIENGVVTLRGLVLRGRLRDLKRYLAHSKPFRFKSLMLQSPGQFYSGPVSVKYAQAWTMLHFFKQGAGGRYRPVLDKYIRLLRSGSDRVSAFNASFAKVDLIAAEKAWLAYVKKLKL